MRSANAVTGSNGGPLMAGFDTSTGIKIMEPSSEVIGRKVPQDALWKNSTAMDLRSSQNNTLALIGSHLTDEKKFPLLEPCLFTSAKRTYFVYCKGYLYTIAGRKIKAERKTMTEAGIRRT